MVYLAIQCAATGRARIVRQAAPREPTTEKPMPEPGADPHAVARAASAAMHAADHASQALGMRVLEIGPGSARVSMTVRRDMLNGHAVCHGGILFALADTAFAHACNSHNRRTLASAASIEFLQSAREGEVLTAHARERQRGRRAGVYDVEVLGAAGGLVALFRGRSVATDEPLARAI
jgi:acyl-CoA thioesterase